MIVTRGFNSNAVVTRGYGIVAEFVKGVCVFYKKAILRLFSRDKQKVTFKKDCT